MNQTESVAESRWGVGLEKLTGGFVKKDSARRMGGGCMCCTHGKSLNSVVLFQLPDTSETEDLLTGTSIVTSQRCFKIRGSTGLDQNHSEPRGGARASEDV